MKLKYRKKNPQKQGRILEGGGKFPPSGGEIFCSIWKTGKNLKEDLKKGKEKGGKEEEKQ